LSRRPHLAIRRHGDARNDHPTLRPRHARGAKSVPLSVSSAQRISGVPASAPEIFSALGPGPPPIRVEGRDEATRKLTEAAPGTKVTITGNLDAGNAFLTLMEVEVAKSAGAE
jgi:hypothetical protein